MTHRPLLTAGATLGTTSVSDGSGDWRERAACLDEDPELFYPVGESSVADREQTREAKAVCRRCDVIDTCLRYALDENLDTGIWGGLTERERRSMRRRNRATKDAPTAERDARRAVMLTELPALAAAGLSIHEAAITLNTATNYIARILADQPALLERLRRNTSTPRHVVPADSPPSAPTFTRPPASPAARCPTSSGSRKTEAATTSSHGYDAPQHDPRIPPRCTWCTDRAREDTRRERRRPDPHAGTAPTPHDGTTRREADMTLTDLDPPLVLEGFAGPGGWSTGLAMLLAALGFRPRSLAVEWDDAACRTAHAAGHTRVRADVARFDLTAFADPVWLLIMSPPCQAWSRSGKRKGILDQAAIFRHAQRVTAAGEWINYTDAGPLPAGEGDEGGTWHDARSPLVLEVLRWVLATQPANIALEQVPDVLPFWELIVRWLRPLGYNVWAGCLSSERYGVPQTRERAILIASRERAVSAPPATHTAYDARLADGGKWHGTHDDLFGGGLEPWVSMAEALGWGFNAQPAPTVTGGGTGDGTRQVIDPAERPAPTLTAKSGGQWVLRTGQLSYQTGRTKADLAEYVRPVDAPVPTVTAQVGAYWSVAPEDASRRRRPGNPESDAQSVRITVEEAAALQSFPPGYPWHGSKSARHRQVGDAVPPLLAAHILAACLGVQVPALERAA